MSLFPLSETSVELRGQVVLVRELTHGERIQFAKTADKYSGPALLISIASVNPKISVEMAESLPADVVERLVGAIMTLSGMESEPAKKA